MTVLTDNIFNNLIFVFLQGTDCCEPFCEIFHFDQIIFLKHPGHALLLHSNDSQFNQLPLSGRRKVGLWNGTWFQGIY